MIIYSLRNSSITLDVFEDKVVLTPKSWLSMFSSKWSTARVIHFKDLNYVEIEKHYWPMRHRLHFVSGEEKFSFEYRQLEAFYEQLKIYLERQILKHHQQAVGPISLKILSISEIVEERKKKIKRNDSIAA